MPSFQVVDSRTGRVVSTFKRKQAARDKRERLDLEFGAVRFSVREIADAAPVAKFVLDVTLPEPLPALNTGRFCPHDTTLSAERFEDIGFSAAQSAANFAAAGVQA